MEHLKVWRCLLGLIASILLCKASNAPCTLNIAQDMITHLIKNENPASDCEGAWNDLLSYLQQTRRNLTECNDREAPGQMNGTPSDSCHQLLAEGEKKANETFQKLDKKLRSKSLYEQVELAKVEKEQERIQDQIDEMRIEQKGYYQQLLLLYIDSADTRRAFHYYQQLVSLKERDVPQQIVKFVYASKRKENRRLENMLNLIRYIPKRKDKRTMYQLVQPEIIKRPTQNQSTLAMRASLEMGSLMSANESSAYQKQREVMYQYVLTRWMFQRLAGNYGDIVAFATKYPQLYKRIGVRIATIHPQYWWKFRFSQFVTFPNMLPLPSQRMEAFRKIMYQLKQRNQKNFVPYLAWFAPQLDIFEKFLKKRNDELDFKEDLIKLKGEFADFDKKKDYEYYLKNSKSIIEENAKASRLVRPRNGRRRTG